MENTLTLFEKDTEKQWFIAPGSKLLGPLSGKELALWVSGGDVSPAAFAWRDGMAGWQRIYEIEAFQPLLPPAPSDSFLQEAKSRVAAAAAAEAPPPAPAPAEKAESGRRWFLFHNDAQYGPFDADEIRLMVEGGRVTADSFLWTKGMADWQPAGEVSELNLSLSQPEAPTAKAGKKSEKRNNPRVPFQAKILLTDGKEVGWALCRDISIGGMQILIDQSPGPKGTKLKLNVDGMGNIPAFACEGEVVRILEDGRGFSFRFLSLPDEARAAIEQYIAS